MKRCPYCAEAVQDDTQVCPHCRMSVTGNVAQPTAPPPPLQPSFSQTPAPPPPPPPPMGGGGYATGPSETSGKAIGSLVSALVFPFFGGIVAIILGHISLSEIKKSAGRLKGDGLAMAGLILGYLQVAGLPFILIIAAIAIPNLIKSKMAANEASAVGSLRTLTTAEISYSSTCPKIGFASSLQELGPGGGTVCPDGKNLIDFSLASGLKNGYRFTPHVSNFTGQAPETGFGWNADPVNESTGSRHFFVDQTGVIRYTRTGQADENSENLQ
jgi:type IV pilus assembly protein PilA